MSINNYAVKRNCPSVRQSLAETLELVKAQIDYHDFYNPKTKIVPSEIRSFVLIMTEVLLINPREYIEINGSLMKVEDIQQIYKLITYEHIEMIYKKYIEIRSGITKIKPYIRTMLYNSVFELDLFYSNQINSEMI